MSEELDLLREWDEHNRSRHKCYYESPEYDGMGTCPSYYSTLRDFFGASGFVLEKSAERIYGRRLDESNFRSRLDTDEFPVRISDSVVEDVAKRSIRAMREQGRLKRSEKVDYGTDDVLRDRAQRAGKAPSENEQSAWQVEAMEYFKERLDEIHESMVRAFSGVMVDQSRLHTRIDALVAEVTKANDERSESGVAVTPQVTITLNGVPADIAQELEDELGKRIERLMSRRSGR